MLYYDMLLFMCLYSNSNIEVQECNALHVPFLTGFWGGPCRFSGALVALLWSSEHILQARVPILVDFGVLGVTFGAPWGSQISKNNVFPQ